MQPNYAVKDTVTAERLDVAFNRAIEGGLSLEMEFNNKVLKKWGDYAYRMIDYMDAFERFGVWDTMSVAYYQGEYTLYNLYRSTDSDDKALYQRLAEIVAKRQKQLK